MATVSHLDNAHLSAACLTQLSSAARSSRRECGWQNPVTPEFRPEDHLFQHPGSGKGHLQGILGRSRVISPGHPAPSSGSSEEDPYSHPHKDLQTTARAEPVKQDWKCLPPHLLLLLQIILFNSRSWPCIGFSFGLVLVLAEPIHLFRQKHMYMFCLPRATFLHFLQEKFRVEAMELIQRKQHDGVAVLAELSGWLMGIGNKWSNVNTGAGPTGWLTTISCSVWWKRLRKA